MNSRSDRRISQDLKRTLRANNKAVIYNGTAIASNQGKVLVYVPALGQQIQAIAMGAVPTGPCQIYKTNSGWVVKSEVTNQVTREQGSDRRARERARSFRPGNIKILFSRPIQGDPNNRREYWLGGDREEPIKVGEDLVEGFQGTFYLHNTGRGKKDYLLCRGWVDTTNPSDSKFYAFYTTGRRQYTQVISLDLNKEEISFYYGGNGCFIVRIIPRLFADSGGVGGGYDSGSSTIAYEGGGLHTTIQGSSVSSATSSSGNVNSSTKYLRVTMDEINSQSVSISKSWSSTNPDNYSNSMSAGLSASGSFSALGLGNYKATDAISGSEFMSGSEWFDDITTTNETVTPHLIFYHKLSSLTGVAERKYSISRSYQQPIINIDESWQVGKRVFLGDSGIGDNLAFSAIPTEMSQTIDLAGDLPIDRDGELRNPVTIEFNVPVPPTLRWVAGLTPQPVSSSKVASWVGINLSKPGFLIVKNNHEDEENRKGFWEYEGSIQLEVTGTSYRTGRVTMNITKRKAIDWHWKIGAPLNKGKLETTQFSPVFYQKENQKYVSSLFSFAKRDYEELNASTSYNRDMYSIPDTYDPSIINTYLNISVTQSLDYDEPGVFDLSWDNLFYYYITSRYLNPIAELPERDISQVKIFHSDQSFWNWTGKKFFNAMFLNSVLESDQVLWVEEMTVKSGSPPTLVRKWHPVEVYSLKCESEVRIHQASAWLP